MPNRSDLIYRYDGSFDGLLCCVFASYDKKEIPMDILPPGAVEPLLFPVENIITDAVKAERVLRSIPLKMGSLALDFVRRAFLTCLCRKELYILQFLRLGYHHGAAVMNMLTDEVVHTLSKAVKHLEKERERYSGFLRFSVYDQVLVAQMEPKNLVLPLLAQHFCTRYPQERFLIYDKTHGMGLVYKPYQSAVIPIEELDLPEPDAAEQSYRELWQLFYRTIEIQGRHNPTGRLNHMPKRYWKYLTEFGTALPSSRKPDHSKYSCLDAAGWRLLTKKGIDGNTAVFSSKDEPEFV